MTKLDVYTIDSGVPVPEGLPPIAHIEVGDSIAFSGNMAASLRSRANFLKRTQGKVFTIKKIDEQTARVWRIQ